MIASAVLTKLFRYSYAVHTWLQVLEHSELCSLADFCQCPPEWEDELKQPVSLLAEIYGRSPRLAAFQSSMIHETVKSLDIVKTRDAIRSSLDDLNRQIHKWYSLSEKKRVKCLVGNYGVDTATVIEARITWLAECLRVK